MSDDIRHEDGAMNAINDDEGPSNTIEESGAQKKNHILAV
jgi:hypothetical protein